MRPTRSAKRMLRLAKRDMSLRDEARLAIEHENSSWPATQRLIVEALKAFVQSHDHNVFSFHSGGPSFNLNDGSIIKGESFAMLRMDNVLTGKENISPEGVIDKQIETGAQLIFHFSHPTGLLQVFVRPPYWSGNSKKPEDCLIWYSHSLKLVSERFVARMVRRLLAFQRVESVAQYSYGWEKLQVRYWRFIDARNRRRLLPEQSLLFNGWELAVIAGFIALAGFLVSLLKD